MTIFDRLKIDVYNFPNIENKAAHSKEIAAMAVRVAAASYALTSLPDASTSAPVADQGPNIPFQMLKRELAAGRRSRHVDWIADEGGANSFSVNVVGGGAFGILVGDTIFVGFRGTSNVADWSINLFGLTKTGPLRIPPLPKFDHHLRCGTNYLEKHAAIHAGFYRISQALRQPVDFELDKLRNNYAKRNVGGQEISVILCGHSLGGALALACGMHLHNHHDAVYTFGMPRVSSAGILAMLPPNHFRYTLEGDPVPKLPFQSLGFFHDMPSINLDPYHGLPKPTWVAKAIRGFASSKSWLGAAGASAKAVFASEHDMELYADTVMAQ